MFALGAHAHEDVGMPPQTPRAKKPPRPLLWEGPGRRGRIPAMTDFRAVGTIMGPAGLTAVFGMGTGGTPPVWSPESRPGGGQAPRPQSDGSSRALDAPQSRGDGRRPSSLRDGGPLRGDASSSGWMPPTGRPRPCW